MSNSILGTSAAETINGTSLGDEIEAGSGNDTIYAGAGDDIVHGDLGKDTIYLEGGNDTVIYDSSDVVADSDLYGSWGYSYITDIIDGGFSTDTISFRETNTRYDVTKATFTNVEALDFGNSNNWGTVARLTIDQLKSFEDVDTTYDHDWTSNYEHWLAADDFNSYYLDQFTSLVLRPRDYPEELLDYETASLDLSSLPNFEIEKLYVDGYEADITASDANLYVSGGESSDTISGGSGKDLFGGNEGDDSLFGNAGTDTIFGGSGGDTIDGGADNDRLFGEGGNDNITAGEGDDFIDGGSGNDNISAGAGSDRIKLGYGTDAYSGDAGADVFEAQYQGSGAIDGGDGEDSILVVGDFDLTAYSISNVEKLLLGGRANVKITAEQYDSLTIEEDDAAVSVTYAIQMSSPGTIDLSEYPSVRGITGTSGEDTILGNDQRNNLEGGDGADTLRGENERDTLEGGAGPDTLYGGDDRDQLYGQVGNDKLYGGAGNDTLRGGQGDDQIYGEAGDDTIIIARKSDENNSHADLVSSETNLGRYYPYMDIGDLINGGDGTDTLHISQYSLSPEKLIDLLNSEISNIEKIEIDATAPVRISGDTANALTTVEIVNEPSTEHLLDDADPNAWGKLREEIFEISYDQLSEWSWNSAGELFSLAYEHNYDAANDLNNSYEQQVFSPLWITSSDDFEISSLWEPRRYFIEASADIAINVQEANTSDNHYWLYGGDTTLTASSGSDHFYGSKDSETIYAGGGNDVIKLFTGDDVVYAGAGEDRIELALISSSSNYFGDAGNDAFEFKSYQSLQNQSFDGTTNAVLDGGEGTDTLRLSVGDSDLSNFTFRSIEKIYVQADGIYILPKAFIDTNPEIIVADSVTDYAVLGRLTEASIIDESTNTRDVGVSGSDGADTIYGGFGSDTLIGNKGADTIYGNASDDEIRGGAGADQLYGGLGADTFVVDDTDEIALGNYSSQIDGQETGVGFQKLVRIDHIDGGDGEDSLILKFNDYQDSQALYFSENSLTSIETVKYDWGIGREPYYQNVIVDAGAWNAVNAWELQTGNDTNWPGGSSRLFILGDGEDISLDSLSDDFITENIRFKGNFSSINLSDFNGYSERFEIEQAASVTGRDADDTITVGWDVDWQSTIPSNYDIDLAGGDDRLTLQLQSSAALSGEIKGGAGENELFLNSDSGSIFDLTNISLTGIEKITTSEASLVLTVEQFDAIDTTSVQSVFVKKDGVIEGRETDDTFEGLGSETVRGGAGDDQISNVKTVDYLGNQAEFTITRNAENLNQLTVEHSGGDGSQGTDTVSNVLELKFSDGSYYTVDDHHNFYSPSVREIQYEEIITGTAEHRQDLDWFEMELAPNSPVSLEANAGDASLRLQARVIETDDQIYFKNLTYGWTTPQLQPSDDKWLPTTYIGGVPVPFSGGLVEIDQSVGNWGNQTTQPYTFSIVLQDDYTDSPSTTGAMDPTSGEIQGYIGDLGDVDWIATDLVEGTTYIFDVIGRGGEGGTLVDPEIEIFYEGNLSDPVQTSIVSGASGADERVQFHASEAGRYYISVSDASGLYTGSYTVTQKSKDLQSADIHTTGRVDYNQLGIGTVDGEINDLADRDWFRVELQKGYAYKIEAVGASTSEGTLDNPFVEVRSATGILLNSASDGGTGNNAQLYFQAPEDGNYFIGAASAGNAGKGTYQVRVSGIPDDHDGSRSTTSVLSVDDPIHALIHVNQDTDWFKVGLSEGQTYVVSAKADKTNSAELDPLRDPFVSIRDFDGRVVAFNDDWGKSFDANLFFTPDETAQYFIETSSAFKYDTGAYTLELNLAPADDFADGLNDLETALGIMSLGQEVSGEIQTPGDVDWFEVNLQADITYEVSAKAQSSFSGTLVDPAFRIFSAGEKFIEYADDGALGTDALSYFTAPTSGKYFFEVSSDDNIGLGSYKFQVNETALPSDDVGSTVTSARLLNTGESFDGNLLKRGDEDWFAVDLVAGSKYMAILSGQATGGGTLLDPYLELLDNAGNLITFNDNGSWQNDARISFVPTSSGRYYLNAKTLLEDETGTYKLTLRAPDDHGSTIMQATQISLGETIAGGIQWADGRYGAKAVNMDAIPVDRDEDWFSIDLTTGQIITVSVKPDASNGLSRALFEIISPNGHPVARADGKEVDDGTASVAFTAQQDGTYSIRVVDGAGSTGNYTISTATGDISDEDPQGINSPVLLNFINGEAFKVAKIGIAGDTDTFKLEIAAESAYRVEVVSVRDGLVAPIEDSSIRLLFTPAGENTLNELNAMQASHPERMATAVVEQDKSGELFVEVSATDSLDAGQYALRIIDLSVQGGDEASNTITEFDADDAIIALGDSLNAQLNDDNDVDLFGINITAGQRIQVNLKGYDAGEGTLAVPNVSLISSSGQVIAKNTVATDGIGSLDVNIFETDLYYIQVDSGNIEGNFGTYVLETLPPSEAQQEDDIPGDFSSVEVASPGNPLQTSIDFDGDVDFASISLEAGTPYVIDVLAAGAQRGELEDAKLFLYDQNGILLNVDDDSGAGLDSRLRILGGEEAQTIYAGVAGNNGETGSYQLRVRKMYTGEYDPRASEQWYSEQLRINDLYGEYTGAGISIGVIDDGIDYAHPDLVNQLNYSIDYDAQYLTDTGEHKWPPLPFLPPDDHGTPVAGIMVAEQNNETGIVGLAPDAEVASFRVKWANSHMSGALARQNQVDVSNNSWGTILPFADDFSSATYMQDYANMRYAVEYARDGYGTAIVFSAGNSRSSGDNVNHHNFQNARETITVASVSANDTISSFSTPGAAILVAAYGENILTTDRLGSDGLNRSSGDAGDYVNFGGTSAAAPEVSAIIALMLEANPNLGYRDIQTILAHSTRHPESASWKQNTAVNHNLGGHFYNDDMGFGIIDGFAAVRLAETWKDSKTAHNEVFTGARLFDITSVIPDADENGYLAEFEINSDLIVEHAELGIDLRHSRLGDLQIELVSPNGTVSRLLDRPTATEGRPYGLFGEYSNLPNHLIFDLSSTQFLGEDASGSWTVRIKDVRAEFEGTVYSLSLRLYGQGNTGNDQYVFTDEFASAINQSALRDDEGIDWINAASVSTASEINLSARTFTIAGRDGLIETWVDIENVVTGDGNDQIIGSELDNMLLGGRGDDTITPGFGSDFIDGGKGSDVAVFAGNREDYEYSYNNSTKEVTVVTSRIENASVINDSNRLTGVEVLQFDDAVVNLSNEVGNFIPVANVQILEAPLVVEDNSDFEVDVPEGAFSDNDQEELTLSLSAELEGGLELPDWMSFDEKSGKLIGSPPEGALGRYKVLVKARDDFGEEASQTLSIEVGDNMAPIVDDMKVLELDEDSEFVPLDLSIPTDPEGGVITILVSQLPTGGKIKTGTGASLSIDDSIPERELSDLVFSPTSDFVGDPGSFKYLVTDQDGVFSEGQINFLVKAVNDAPEFGFNGFVPIEYEGELVEISLEVATPLDAEEELQSVDVMEIPVYGTVLLNGNTVSVGDQISLSDLQNITFQIDEYINGSVGSLGLKATDSLGLEAFWKVQIQVNGEAGLVSGTAQDDELFGSLDSDRIFGLNGNDIISSNAGNDTVFGGSGSDIILTGQGDDLVNGGGGDDYIDGGDGNDIMAGGPGNDIFIVDQAGDVVTEVLSRGAGGIDTVRTSINYIAPSNVEVLEAQESENLSLTGNELDNILEGNDGNNVLIGADGLDILIGKYGSDELDGGNGRDQMVGGSGDDKYWVDSRSDIIYEEINAGSDTVFSSSSYVLSANVEDLILLGSEKISGGGNSLDNRIIGNESDNFINGGLGADHMEGGLGDDIYVMDSLGDTIVDTGGIDTIRASIEISLPNGIENLTLIGLLNINGQGNDGDNEILGNSGNNLLNGGLGSDILVGGNGDDGFILDDFRSGVDTIRDFQSGSDLLMIDAVAVGLFDPETLTGYSGTVEESNFGRTENPNGDHLFEFNPQNGNLFLTLPDSFVSNLILSVDLNNSDEIIASDIYALL